MNTLLTEPVLAAEARAMAEALKGNGAASRDRLSWLLRAYLPSLVNAPAFLRRLLGQVGSWLVKHPPTESELEETRRRFFELLDLHLSNLRSAETAARSAGFSATEMSQLTHATEALEGFEAELNVTWPPFSEEFEKQVEDDIRAGRLHDLEEVIRELQGRPQ